MNAQIDTTVKRARAYPFVDGFAELGAGALLILLGGIMLLRGGAQQAPTGNGFLSMAAEISIVKLVGILAVVLALWWLKARFTYPRTGYVRGPLITATQAWVIARNVVVFLLVPVMVLVLASVLSGSATQALPWIAGWLPLAVGFAWATLCIVAGEWMGLRRFRILGAAILLTGLAISIWQSRMGYASFLSGDPAAISQTALLAGINRTLASLSILVLFSGVFLIASGLVTFLRYRSKNPLPYAEAE